MWLYKGGTIHEPELQRYSFTYNFFSDLGRHHTPDGELQSPCRARAPRAAPAVGRRSTTQRRERATRCAVSSPGVS